MMAFLQNAIVYVAPFLMVITLIVVVHELGHFLTARLFGVAVDRFSIGFGRAVWSRVDRAGVEWRIGWLPLGGYVRFAGDDNASSMPDQNDLSAVRASIIAREGAGAENKYLQFKPLWQRTLVVLAGPAANFVLTAVLFSTFFLAFGEPATSTRIDGVTPASPAARAGFLSGDRILGADGRTMRTFQDVQFYVQYRGGTPIDFTILRSGRTIHIDATPDSVEQPSPFGGKQSVGMLGLAARSAELQHFGPVTAVVKGAQKTWDVAETTVFYLGRIVTGHVSADQLHSFVGMAHASGAITEQAVSLAHASGVSWVVTTSYFLLQLAALMSVSVGLLNLLPIPALDGGHLLFYAYESVARRPPNAALQAAGYRVGLALLVSLMLFATWNDLHQLRVIHFLGSLFS